MCSCLSKSINHFMTIKNHWPQKFVIHSNDSYITCLSQKL